MLVTPHHYCGKKVGVLGLGRSGQATLQSLLRAGAFPFVWDDQEERRSKAEAPLLSHDTLKHMTALFVSPGIPLLTHPMLKEARLLGVKLTSDIEELSISCPQARLIGITGTNGKSTTTALVGHVLSQAGYTIQVGGNCGVPCLSLEALSSDHFYVLEVSSYQMDLLPLSPFSLAALLNITPDHLERYGSKATYAASKKRLFLGQKEGTDCIVGDDDPQTRACAQHLRQQGRTPLLISGHHKVEGIYSDGHHLMDGRSDTRVCDLRSSTHLRGQHNAQNIAAAYALTSLVGVSSTTFSRALVTFSGLEHRQERVASYDHLLFINDSAGTNPESTAQALSLYENIYWIAGGHDKGCDFSVLAHSLHHVRHAFFIGSSAHHLYATFKSHVPSSLSLTLGQALHEARTEAARHREPAVILFSPACASFDQFKDYVDRGRTFKALVTQGETSHASST